MITLFGATTPLGRLVVARLIQKGHRLSLPVQSAQVFSLLKTGSQPAQVVPFLCAVRDDFSVREAVRGSQIVINLLEQGGEKAPPFGLSAHVEGVARLARIAREEGVSTFVQLSCLGVSEKASSSYDRVRFAGERAIHTFFVDAIIVRIGALFDKTASLGNSFFSLLVSGETDLQPAYLHDVVSALCAAIDRPEARGRIFELAGTDVLSRAQFEKRLCTAKGRSFYAFSLPRLLVACLKKAMKIAKIHGRITSGLTPRLAESQNTGVFPDLGIRPKRLEEIFLP